MAFQSIWYYTDLPEEVVKIAKKISLSTLMDKWQIDGRNAMAML